ncbi:MAG: hypothetical protein M1837_002077 [Sclerophora amabilis]|nr:MAG: hypothetical protein M1837_002077 [Sclerophora amabilis]
MFQSFTGNSRRSRQVNLSGRNANPFGAPPPGPRSSPAAPGPQHSLANAQQERLSRQRERDRIDAARKIQRVWRGSATRGQHKARLRREWDNLEPFGHQSISSASQDLEQPAGAPRVGAPFPSEDQCMLELRLLPQFIDTAAESDLRRLDGFTLKLLRSNGDGSLDLSKPQWKNPLRRLGRLSLKVLISKNVLSTMIDHQLSLLDQLADLIPNEMAYDSHHYYGTLSMLITNKKGMKALKPSRRSTLLNVLLKPLRAPLPKSPSAYEGFAESFLTTPDLQAFFGSIDSLLSGLDYQLLCNALTKVLEPVSAEKGDKSIGQVGKLWLLAYFICFQSTSRQSGATTGTAPNIDYVNVVSILLRSLAEEISQRIDIEDAPASPNSGEESDMESPDRNTKHSTYHPLPRFVRQQVLSLVNQESVTSLLTYADVITSADEHTSSSYYTKTAKSRLLASYALTLLRIFPRKADEIRMWLYLGSTSLSNVRPNDFKTRVPAVKFFWQASRGTTVFKTISQEPRAAVELLRPNPAQSSGGHSRSISDSLDYEDRDQEWTTILIFFELYSFVLKVMDDEEFFSTSSIHIREPNQGSSSWTKESALHLQEVQELTIFLKNLGFTLYWNATDLAGMDQQHSPEDIRTYFSTERVPKFETEQQSRFDSKTANTAIAGVKGMTVEYVKGIVTGLLRMVYERDSRRPFLPKHHWLMTGRFDMESFIPAVVSEEENRYLVQEADEADSTEDEGFSDEDMPSSSGMVGTQHARRTQNLERLRKQQWKASRKKYLEALTPRLEILQNMPFFIPFATRVQIFRRFVFWDQNRRRGGHIDPDHWRMSVMEHNPFQRIENSRPTGHDIISRHHAKIRRESVFEDAYEQFYGLGDGLKEPIQITFVDKFDTVEAGIDGGGVTKEFLTSVTNEAFSSSNGLDLFIENDQNLLYPNPAALDERKDILEQAGLRQNSSEWNDNIRDLLRRYEFLGRIIGKCLYEGILVDVGFAPFFLLKWALTGGSKAASRESSYRANMNDLRDLDESLYQGLLQLKNYPGNVEDFSLNFTITDTISTPHKTEDSHNQHFTRTVTRDLRPNGSNIPVTNENRLFYISYVARHRLQVQPRPQTNAFLRGLGEVIQPEWLAMFNQSEIQTLVGGDASEIDVDDLRKNTLYGGVYTIGDDNQEHPSIQLFWQVMRALSDPNRRKVLKFVTSTPRGPLLGFSQLNPRFSIRDAGADQERLPSTSTCVNLLKLPRYDTARVLEEKLLYAVNAGAGFDLS